MPLEHKKLDNRLAALHPFKDGDFLGWRDSAANVISLQSDAAAAIIDGVEIAHQAGNTFELSKKKIEEHFCSAVQYIAINTNLYKWLASVCEGTEGNVVIKALPP
jgi:hypothetical protein